MKDKMTCELHYHPVCSPCGMSFMPVTICETRRTKRASSRRKKIEGQAG